MKSDALHPVFDVSTFLLRKCLIKVLLCILAATMAVYCTHFVPSRLFGLSADLDHALTCLAGSLYTLAVVRLVSRKQLAQVWKYAENAWNSCSETQTSIREHLQQTVEDLPQYTGLLATQLREATSQTETALLSVVERMVTVHEKARFQVDQIGSSSEKSSELIEVTQDQIRKNNQVIQALNTFSETQSEQLKDNLMRIQRLSDEMEQMRPLVDTISDIADRTNLLALNAAIEAARAGEAGRGFAVVADEVRRLSTQTNQAAKEITGRITMVAGRAQTETENARKLIEKEEQSQKFKTMAGNLSDIEDRFKTAALHLEQVIHSIDSANRMIVEEVSTVLGEVQFQDVLRQRIEHVTEGLVYLTGLAGDTARWLDGAAEVPKQRLSEHLNVLNDKYVMNEQRVTHNAVLGKTEGASHGSTQKIELF